MSARLQEGFDHIGVAQLRLYAALAFWSACACAPLWIEAS